jgi:hypothetical protein
MQVMQHSSPLFSCPDFCDETSVIEAAPLHFRARQAALAALCFAALTVPALARDSLGMFGSWAAFRDSANGANAPRCYAIAMAAPSSLQRDYQPYADVASWPRQNLRGQVHFRLSRRVQPGAGILLTIGGQHFSLTGGGGDAWAADRRMDAGIVAAMRSAGEMTVSARGADGRGFSNTWQLDGAATAMDAATVGCARVR